MYKLTIINTVTLEMLEQFFDTLEDAVRAMEALQFAGADYCDAVVTDMVVGEEVAWY